MKEKELLVIDLPLEIQISSKKKFILNLNNYRNTHFRSLSAAKINYSKFIIATSLKPYKNLKINIPVCFQYTLYCKTRQLSDIGNVISIIDKFTSDAIVTLGIIPDDNYNHIKEVRQCFGGVDKSNPRCVLRVLPLTP